MDYFLLLLAVFFGGCVKNINIDATQYNEIAIGAETRHFLLYVPAKFRSKKENLELPVVFSLHGRGGSGSQVASYNKFKELSESTGEFIGIFPDGQCAASHSNCEWNIGNSGGNLDDVTFFDTMIKHFNSEPLFHSTKIDIKNSYFVGHSQGAYMSYRYARENTVGVRAIAPYAGHDNWHSGKTPKTKTSVIHIHGMQDSVVPVESIPAYGSYKYDVEYWMGYNGCSPVSNESYAGYVDLEGYVKLYKYSSCPTNAKVRGMLFPFQGHDWPVVPNGKVQNNFTIGSSTFAELVWNQLKEMVDTLECNPSCIHGTCSTGNCTNCERDWSGVYCNIFTGVGEQKSDSVFIRTGRLILVLAAILWLIF